MWSGPKIARWLAKYHGLKCVHGQRGWDALIAIAYSIQPPRPRHPGTAAAEDHAKLKKTHRRDCMGRRKHPGAKIEIWAENEHRIGLKPITRGPCGRLSANLRWRSAIIASSGSI